MPSGLSHLFLHTGDVDAARRFWVHLLGLEALLDDGGYLRIGGGKGFHAGIERGEPPERTELVVRVDDVDAAVERLRAAGVDVEDAADQRWGARHPWLRDPDGRPVSIYTALDDEHR
jgi:catechol 2,3-dioxygenase-like lactoylglutathione lyase family enzyme